MANLHDVTFIDCVSSLLTTVKAQPVKLLFFHDVIVISCHVCQSWHLMSRDGLMARLVSKVVSRSIY